MKAYKCVFIIGNVFINMEMEGKLDEIDEACEHVARAMGITFLYKEEVA